MGSNEQAGDDGCDWGGALSALHHSDSGEDDQEGFEFLAGGEGGPGAGGHGVGELPNVVMLQDAAQAIKTGEITMDQFIAVYKKLETKATNALKLWDIPAVKKDLPGKLTEQQNQIWSGLEEQLWRVKEGADLLTNYTTTHQLGDLETGVEMISNAITAAVEIQKIADAEYARIMEEVKEEKAKRAQQAAETT